MAGGERVEQLALHLRAGEARSLLFELAAQQFLELVEILEAEVLGEFVVDGSVGRDLHLLDGDVELRVLALEVFGRVIFGEGDRDGLLVARLHTGKLLFEAGDELARTDNQRGVFRLAAFEFDTVDAADEIDDQLIAVASLLGLGGILVALVVRGDALDRFVHLLVGHGNNQAFEFEAVHFGSFDFGQDFDIDAQRDVLAFFIAFVELDLGLHGGTQLVVGHHLVDRFADHVVDRLRVNLLAVHFAHQVGRHLPRAEAGHLHLRSDLLHFAGDALVDILGRNGDGIGALQAFVGGLFDLHGLKLVTFQKRIGARGFTPRRHWCGRRDSNPHIFRYWYLKPARLPVPPRPLTRTKLRERR